MSTIKSRRDDQVPGVEPSDMMGKLDDTRQELARYHFWLTLSRALVAGLIVGSVVVFADWMWVLPVAVRGLGLLATIVTATWVLIRSRRQIDRASAAVDVEANFPELGQRVRTVVEYAEPAPDTVPACPGLVKALSRDTDRLTSGIEFRNLVRWAPFERRAVALFVASLVGIVALFMNAGFRTAAFRMLLLPRHYTALSVKPGDTTVKAGDELKLEITLSGRPVRSASWSYRAKDNGGQWITTALAADGGNDKAKTPLVGSLHANVKDCQTDFDYRVVAGDVESPTFHVKVVHPLLLKDFAATVTPPAYTKRPAAVVKDGNLRAIEGSRVEIAVTLDRAPQSAALVLGAPGDSSRQSIPLQIDGARVVGELPPIVRDVQYEIAAADGEGMKLEAESYRIKVEADQAPTIHFIKPEESLAVTPTTEVPIEVVAGDDFGVARVGINYKLGDGPEETLHLASLEAQPVTAEALATLYLEKHKLSFTDAVTYYAFVEDNYPAKPHRVVSELRYIDILPYKQTYKFIEGQPGRSQNSLTLEELIARQRVNLNRTFLVERDRSIGEAGIMRLATFEEELVAATTEFSEGLKELGAAVPALDDAVSSMRAATLALDAKDVATARPHEETALKLLVSTRRNLQKLLAQGNSGQSSAAQQFDRQQVQRIRRPKQDDKELAELEEDLMELAELEEDFSEEIEAKGGGGANVDPPEKEKAQAKSEEEQPAQPAEEKSRSAQKKGSNQKNQKEMDSRAKQRRAAEEAERLRRLARRDKALTDLAKQRLEAAAKAVQDASQAMEQGRESDAARQAREAASKLKSAARQIGALKAKEITDRLARQRDLAQAIAKAERELGRDVERGAEPKDGTPPPKEQLAGKQNQLADDVTALGDVLTQLKLAAAEELPELALSISRATAANPPADVEDAMRKNAAAIGGGQTEPAARSADRIAGQLDALAQDLESVRRQAIQPQLDRLLAAEKQAAELQDRLKSVKQKAQQGEAEKAFSDFAHTIDKLAPGDGPVRETADNLTNASTSSHAGWVWNDVTRDGEAGYFTPPVTYSGSLSAAILALQARIQEIVLDSALVERTGPVPPQYKNLVEDYYRVLSQDLR
jgi:hypothetical protein